jgi:hypothetical protein
MPGASFAAANRAATYSMALTIVVLVADSGPRRRLLSGVFAAVSAVVAVYALALCAGADNLNAFDENRLFGPIGYPNGVAMFVGAGLWPLVAAGSQRTIAPHLRALALAGAAAIAPVVLLTVSRAGLGFVLLAGLVYVVCSPVRVRGAIALGVALAPTGLQLATLREPYRLDALTLASVHAAGRAGLVATVLAGIGGATWALLDRRFDPPAVAGRLGRLGLAAIVAVTLAVGAVVAVRHDARGVAATKWEKFKAGSRADSDQNTDRYLTVGTNRYDFWRVAVLELREEPLLGFGAANWSWPYLAQRRSYETPDNAHGSVWEFAADLGLPGLLLYLAVVVATFAASARPAASQERARQAGLLAALVGAIGHQQVDWLWETFPCGLLIAALSGLALAAAHRPDGAIRNRTRHSLSAIVGAVAIAAILPALLAERYADRSYSSTSNAAIGDARLAATLNPFSSAPLTALARARSTSGDPGGALLALRDAAGREPRAWSTWMRLSIAASAAGRVSEARQACRRAKEINPVAECVA